VAPHNHTTMEPAPTFGPRLRQERERRHISLTSIAENTKISRALLEALERDDVSRWPTGIFRRSFVRSYAQAIGLDPDEVVREFLERFPDPSAANAEAAEGQPQARTPAGRASLQPRDDRVEIVLRFSLPRSWATFLARLTSLAIPGRQNT
jgi:cytoskeletal protein RodZ